MDNQVFCNHIFVSGPKKGQACNRFCRSGGFDGKCGQHKKKQVFKCLECDKSFGENSNLQRHIKTIHLKEKNYKCNFCDKSFGENSNLQRHIKTIHLQEKNFKCNFCDKSFGENSNLQKHIKTVHFKQQKYKCLDCGKSFSQNSHLQTHLKTCTGELKCSNGEFKIMKILDKLQLEYDYDKSHEVVGKNNRLLRWDFKIKDKNIFIEYNGRQHYEAISIWGGEERLKIQQENDECKLKYCKNNNYPFLIIKYTDCKKIKLLIYDFLLFQC